MGLLRVSAQTHPAATAKAIIKLIHTHQHAEVQALGPSALRRVEDAISRATARLEADGIDIVISKAIFIRPGAERNNRSGMKFIIEPRRKPVSVSTPRP